MTAAMHAPAVRRLPGEIVVLGHGQGVHVGTQADHLATAASLAGPAPDERHDAGLANAGVNLVDAAELERLLHALRRVALFKAKLGVGVEIAPQSRDLGMKRGDVRKGAPMHPQTRCKTCLWHQCPPA